MIKSEKKIGLLLLSCFLSVAAKTQIVNIETARMQSDTTGWMGSAGAAVALTKNTEQIFSADIGAHIQYKSQKSLVLLLGSYSFLKGASQQLIDNTFFHLRYNYKLNAMVRWEFFTQLQQNRITGIRSRFLAGMGPRFKLLSTKFIRLYAASLLMYEVEKEKSPGNPIHYDFRGSSYVSFTITPNKQLEIISTSFFQPLIRNFRDSRILNQVSLRVKAGKKLAIRVNWNYLNDSNPVNGFPSVNYSLSTGIDYDF